MGMSGLTRSPTRSLMARPGRAATPEERTASTLPRPARRAGCLGTMGWLMVFASAQAAPSSGRASGPVAIHWLPAWLLACALTAAIPAMAQPAPTPEPTGEQVKAFLENRSDPVVGAWVARKLQPDGAASAAPPAPDATVRQETAQGEVADYLDAHLEVIDGHIVDLRAALPALPAELVTAAGRLTAELSERGLAEIVLLLVAFFGLGFGAELLFAWATSGVVRRIETAPVTAPGPRARVALTRLLLGLARASCFAAGGIGGFLLFTWPPNLRQVVLGYLSAMLVLRLAVAIGRFLFAPGEPRYRMLPMSDRAAALWLFWTRRVYRTDT